MYGSTNFHICTPRCTHPPALPTRWKAPRDPFTGAAHRQAGSGASHHGFLASLLSVGSYGVLLAAFAQSDLEESRRAAVCAAFGSSALLCGITR